MRKLLLVLVVVSFLTACNPQQTAQQALNITQGILNIAKAEEPVIPAVDQTAYNGFVNLGFTLETQAQTCVSGTTAKGALLNCLNTFASGLLNPTELSQLRVLNPTTVGKVQLYTTAFVIGINVAITAFGGTAQALPVVGPVPASSSDLIQLRRQVTAIVGVPQ